MINQKNVDIKIRVPREGIYAIIQKRIASCTEPGKDIVKFPRVFSKLCASLQISKSQAWELLYFFNDLGVIQIVCGHGIKINGVVSNV